MSWLPLSFGAPALLAGLLALPVIWWLLRLTPPKPQTEIFPPLKVLARVLKREETPHKSPWWLTLLRLAMAALIIFALANPVLNPRETQATGGQSLAIVVDNGWASAPDWDVRIATAERLLADAEEAEIPVLLAFTADPANAEIGPFDPAAARDRLNAAAPRPIPTDRPAVLARVADALGTVAEPAVAILSDGLAAEGDEDAFARLMEAGPASMIWAAPDRIGMLGLTESANMADAFQVTAVRGDATAPMQAVVGAFDDRGRRLGDALLSFGAGEAEARGEFRLPFELRNDFSSVAIDGEPQAAATRVLDENSRRRRVALISQSEADRAQPLLSPLYYIRRALEPFADLVEPTTPDLAAALPEIIASGPAMIVMSDVGTIPEAAREQLVDWVAEGGMLVRFAGSRMAASENDPDLMPVALRVGERALGGTLSWIEPQTVSEFPPAGPFADLAPPQEVTVTRQVLAEPAADIVERTWANLADGTPLVTGDRRGDGTIVLFHVTPEATWSSLPISGTFVEMLRRLVQLSRNQGAPAASAGDAAALPPYRMIATDGRLVPPPPEARPLTITAEERVTIENPPGLYGTDDGVHAHNLLQPEATFEPIALPETDIPLTRAQYAFDAQTDLKGPLIAAALLLLALDMLAVLWMGGRLRRSPKLTRGTAVGAASVLMLALALGLGSPSTAVAQEGDIRPGDVDAIAAISETRIAYVVTGDSSIDSISRAGLAGLSRYLVEKTALEPGDPAGVDIETDELAFYPLIYWPVDAGAAMPSDAALARVDAYMQQGGTVLFDTRDQYATGLFTTQASAATLRLRDILDGMNVPALEPVPDDHVLTKTFYILNSFPGRYAGSPLWVEATLDTDTSADRPVRTGDGVTPIMITGNDFAGAWAIDSSGRAMLPTVPSDPMQRVYAQRAGVNIMMYMLTGNYKSDQVHVPAILERLGQ
jgi:hypothetical protein